MLATPVAHTSDTEEPEEPRVVVVVESGTQRLVVVVVVGAAVGTVTLGPGKPFTTKTPGREPAALVIVTEPNVNVFPA